MIAFAQNGCKQRPFIGDMIRRLILLPRPATPCLCPFFFASCLGLILLCAPPLLARDAPRYLFFSIAPESGWNQNHPDSFSRALFDEVANTLLAPENPRLRVGVSYVFSTLETPTNILAQSLRRLLAGSEESGVPVLVTLDG
jgi:hypothetical protein